MKVLAICDCKGPVCVIKDREAYVLARDTGVPAIDLVLECDMLFVADENVYVKVEAVIGWYERHLEAGRGTEEDRWFLEILKELREWAARNASRVEGAR